MYKKLAGITVVFASLMSTTFSANALEMTEIKGVFTNQNGLVVKSFGFCGDGTGAAGQDGFMVNRTYSVKDGLIHYDANGTFIFKLDENGDSLIAVDEFTKQWAAETPYTRDTKTTISCQ